MTRHVILGAGPVAHAIVGALSSRGIDAVVVSRRGTQIHGAQSVAADVMDSDNLAKIVAGSAAVYQSSQPGYHRWPEEFPALQDSVVRAVRGTDAVLVAVENLYG